MQHKTTSSFLFIVLSLLSLTLRAQDTYKRNSSADVQSYIFNLGLNDSTNSIQGKAEITLDFKEEVNEFALDLIAKSETFGMQVTEVTEDSIQADYSFGGNKIQIHPSEGTSKQRTYTITYHGIAERGLVIDTTKFGERTFFGDN